MKRRLLCTSFIIVASFTQPSHAQSDRELATRQELIERAKDASNQGNHTTALAMGKRAAAIKMTPSLRLFIAEEQNALGQLGDAFGNAKQCAVEAEKDAALRNRDVILASCKSLEESLAKRVGRITVKLPSPAPPGLRVTLSGDELNPAVLGVPYVVSPGKMVIEVTAAKYLPFRLEVSLTEGGSVDVDVKLAPDPNAIEECPVGQTRENGTCTITCTSGRVPTADRSHCCYPEQTWDPAKSACSGAPKCPQGMTQVGESCALQPDETRTNTPRPSEPTRSVLPLIVAGAGAALAIAGTVTYVIAGNKFDTLKQACSGFRCSNSTYDDLSADVKLFDALSVGGWVAGGALLGGGTIWYFAQSPSAPASTGARLQLNPVAKSVAVTGTF